MKLQLRKGKEIDRSDMKGNNFVTTWQDLKSCKKKLGCPRLLYQMMKEYLKQSCDWQVNHPSQTSAGDLRKK